MESTARAERFDLQPAASPAYAWEVPQKPVSVRMPFALIDRLEGEAVENFRSLNARGSEIGGVLYGNVSSGEPILVSIEDYELIACDYSRGPLYRLSDADLGKFDRIVTQHGAAGSLAVAGFFRSHTRKGLALDAEDMALFESRFKDPRKIALLIRPFATKACTGGFFIWENGSIRAEGSHLEFPFRSSLLTAFKPGAELPDLASAGLGGALPAPSVPKTATRAQIVPIASRREMAAQVPPLAVETPAPISRSVEPPTPVTPTPVTPTAPPPPVAQPAPPAPSVTAAVVVAPPAPSVATPKEPVVQAAPPTPAPAPSAASVKASPKVNNQVTPVTSKPEANPKAAQQKNTPQRIVTTKTASPAASSPAASPSATSSPITNSQATVSPAPASPAPASSAATVAPAEPPAAKTPAAVKVEEAPKVPAKPAVTEPLPSPEKTIPIWRSSKFTWIALGAVVPLILMVVMFIYPALLHRGSRTPSGTDSSALSLRVERTGGELQLSWNRDSDPIRGATGGVLSISDGPQHQDVQMDLAQLQKGSIAYTPATTDVVFRMEVNGKGQSKTASEMVRALSTRPSPMADPAQTVPAAVKPNTPTPAKTPDPVASTPTTATDTPEEETPAKQPARTLKPFQAESLSARLHPAPASPTDLPDAPSLGQSGNPGTALPAMGMSSPAAPPMAPPAPAKSAAPPAPAPEKKAATGGQIQQAVLIHKKEPEYPRLARETNTKGVVELTATIGADGKVKKVTAVKGHPMLVKAASDAVMQWIYRPTILNGVAVEAQTQVLINFAGDR